MRQGRIKRQRFALGFAKSIKLPDLRGGKRIW
jgi:hypothetical protein